MPPSCTLFKWLLLCYVNFISFRSNNAYEIVHSYIQHVKRHCGVKRAFLGNSDLVHDKFCRSCGGKCSCVQGPKVPVSFYCTNHQKFHTSASPRGGSLLVRVRPQSSGCVGPRHCQCVCYFDLEARIKGDYQRTACSLPA